MDFFYLFNKNLQEAASYKLVSRSEKVIAFSNGSELGWLFFLVGATTSSLLLYSGFISIFPEKEHLACFWLSSVSTLFTVLGCIAGIGTSKLTINLSSKTYEKRDLSLRGIVRTAGPLTDIAGIRRELKVLPIRGGEYPIYLAKLVSGKFKKELIIGISRSKSRIDDLSEMLTRQLGIPVMSDGIDHSGQEK